MRPATIATLALALAGNLASMPQLHAQTGMNRLAQRMDQAQKNFDMADVDRDGRLTREEARKGRVPYIRDHFDAIDSSHQGSVSKQDVIDYIHARQRQAHPSTGTPPGH